MNENYLVFFNNVYFLIFNKLSDPTPGNTPLPSKHKYTRGPYSDRVPLAATPQSITAYRTIENDYNTARTSF